MILPHAQCPLSAVRKVPLFLSLPVCRWSRDGGGGGGRGAESCDRKKSWLSINHSILSGFTSCEDMSTNYNIKIGHNAQYVLYCSVLYIFPFCRSGHYSQTFPFYQTSRLWPADRYLTESTELIYRGPDFLPVHMIWLLPPLQTVSSTGDTHKDGERDKLLTGEGGQGGWRGAKAWPSINHSILFGICQLKASLQSPPRPSYPKRI
jgi:hypothetical protein